MILRGDDIQELAVCIVPYLSSLFLSGIIPFVVQVLVLS